MIPKILNRAVLHPTHLQSTFGSQNNFFTVNVKLTFYFGEFKYELAGVSSGSVFDKCFMIPNNVGYVSDTWIAHAKRYSVNLTDHLEQNFKIGRSLTYAQHWRETLAFLGPS